MHIPCDLGSVLIWRHCNTLCTSGFVDDVTVVCNGTYGIFQVNTGAEFDSMNASLRGCDVVERPGVRSSVLIHVDVPGRQWLAGRHGSCQESYDNHKHQKSDERSRSVYACRRGLPRGRLPHRALGLGLGKRPRGKRPRGPAPLTTAVQVELSQPTVEMSRLSLIHI